MAADCRPDALGTSRTLVVDPKAHPLIGTMQYRETLPLADGEVVLTFDDGFANNATVARPVLEELQMSAVFFVSTRHLEPGRCAGAR